MINSQKPIVSVIIPVYNVEEVLPYCLESLIKQTLSEIEILCVDDASSDHSAAVVRTFEKRDGRVRLLQQEHCGVSAARNLGISAAQGKYTAFVDGDDWVEPDMLQKMVEEAEKQKGDLVVCSASVHCEDPHEKPDRRLVSLQSALTVQSDVWTAQQNCQEIWRVLERPGSWPFIWNKLIRTQVLQDHQISFPEGLALGEDGVFLQILFQYVQKIVFLPNPLYHYRYQRKGSATVNLYQKAVTRFEQHICVVEALLKALRYREILEKNGSYVLPWALEFLYADFVHLPVEERKRVSKRIQTDFKRFGLLEYESALRTTEKRRLRNLLETEKECSKAKRVYDIVRMKVENRMTRRCK